MSLFSRNKHEPEEPSAAEAELDDTDDEEALISSQAEPEPPASEAQNDQTEQMVRELYDRLGQLSANVEERLGSHDAASHKLAALEEQMRKLSSLTEAISSRYNPFLGEAEEEREEFTAPPPAGAAALAETVTREEHDDEPPEEPVHGDLDDDNLAVAAAPAMEWARPVENEPIEVQVRETAAEEDQDLPSWGHEPAHIEDGLAATGPGARVRHVGACFTSSQLMMRWANLLLTSAGDRSAAAEFVDHYKRIGWLSDDAGDRLLEYVDGLTLVAGDDGHGDHRGTAQVHEMSLLYVERLSDHARGCACVLQ